MFDEEFISTWVDRLRDEIPEAAAVLLKGSVARGEAGPYSDLDVDVLVGGDAWEAYLAWIVDHEGRPVHVSVAVQDLDGWREEASEPVSWAYGLPARETTRLLWARDATIREQLDHPWRQHPAAEPELEDTVDALGKARNACLAGDDLGVRQAAMSIARWMPSLLIPMNPPLPVQHPREALDAILAFPVVPPGYREHMLVCLGMSGEATTPRAIHDAAIRLARGAVALMCRHIDLYDDRLPPDLLAMLGDGTIERYIEFLVEDHAQ